MTEALFNESLNKKIAANVLLKSKLLFGIFTLVAFIQFIGIFVMRSSGILKGFFDNNLIFIGPSFILCMVLAQWYMIKISAAWVNSGQIVSKKRLRWMVALESCFPGVLFVFLCSILNDQLTGFSAGDILNSPVLVIIFVLIILSSLYLDLWISIISSIVPAIQYILISSVFLHGPQLASNCGKGILMIVAGIFSGLISKRIREGVMEAVESKNLLINELDRLVHEKTEELHRRNDLVVEQKELIEEKQKEIVDSINYAKRIQRALLASDHLLDTNLKNYFLYFQPKDIVSGDFYWASATSDGSFVLVTADSTGHGVPGAMMSMLNISCINEAVNERKYTDPSKILNHVRERIIQSLSRDGSLEGGKDGMDCSVAVFDFKNKKLSYSAANNPIWIARKNTEGIVELIDLKADRMPVGKHERDSVSFTAHTVDIEKDDLIFTLTDGFADQFGGPKGKKFTSKRLKDILVHNAAKPLNEQKNALAKAMEGWKGELEQIDDICLVGIKI